MRFVCNTLSVFMLAIGVILAVVDATRCLAADDWVYTQLVDTWQAFAPGLLAGVETAVRASAVPQLWELMNAYVLDAPGWAVFFVLALLFHLAAGRRKKPDEFAHIFH